MWPLFPNLGGVHGAGLSFGRCLLRSFGHSRGRRREWREPALPHHPAAQLIRPGAVTSQLCDIIITRATNIREPTAIDMDADAAVARPGANSVYIPDSWVQPNDLALMEQFTLRGPLESPDALMTKFSDCNVPENTPMTLHDRWS